MCREIPGTIQSVPGDSRHTLAVHVFMWEVRASISNLEIQVRPLLATWESKLGSLLANPPSHARGSKHIVTHRIPAFGPFKYGEVCEIMPNLGLQWSVLQTPPEQNGLLSKLHFRCISKV